MNNWTAILYVAIGGALGSVARFKLTGLVMRPFIQWGFPVGTFTVNLLGCLLIGMLAAMGEKYQWLGNDARLLLITGLPGGFTTFSAFGLETFNLMRQGTLGMALAYATASVLCGLICVAIGFWLIKSVSL